jgi:hypothetical protein
VTATSIGGTPSHTEEVHAPSTTNSSPVHDSKSKLSLFDDRRMQMAKVGFKVAGIQIHRETGEVIAVAYRYVGVEEGGQHEPRAEASAASVETV